jgi:hypothetical protein
MMKKLLIKCLAYVAMFMLLIFIAFPLALFWNSVLITDMIFKDIKRRYKSGIKEIKKDDKKREESYK